MNITYWFDCSGVFRSLSESSYVRIWRSSCSVTFCEQKSFRIWEMKNLHLLFRLFWHLFWGEGNEKMGRAYNLNPRRSRTWSFRIFLSWQTEKKEMNLGSFWLTHHLSTHQHRCNLVDVICDWKYILNQYLGISALFFWSGL